MDSYTYTRQGKLLFGTVDTWLLWKLTGGNIVKSKRDLVTTIAVGYDDHVEYALEGSVFDSGAAIQWLRDELNTLTESV